MTDPSPPGTADPEPARPSPEASKPEASGAESPKADASKPESAPAVDSGGYAGRPASVAERHATWLELFFDLTVVVAVSQLAHLLRGATLGEHGHGGLEIAGFFVMYVAIWLLWTSFVLYANIAVDRVRSRSMLYGMGGIALMAAAVPDALHGHATMFGLVYILTAGLGIRASLRTGQVLLSWSTAQQNVGVVPWILSLFFDSQPTQLLLWTLGLAVTLASIVVTGVRGDERMLEQLNKQLVDQQQRRLEHDRRRLDSGLPIRVRGQRGRAVLGDVVTGDDSTPVRHLTAATLDPAHLGERLGLFVIIVLGEAMLQLVGAAGSAEWEPAGHWNRPLIVAAVAGFLLLVAIWWLNVHFGFADETQFPPVLVLPAHLVAIVAITTVATGLGIAVGHPWEALSTGARWLLCGGVAAYLLVVTAMSVRPRQWPLGSIAIVVPLLVGAFGGLLGGLIPSAVVVCVTAAAAGAQIWYLTRANGITSPV